MPENSRYLKEYIISFGIILFCQPIPLNILKIYERETKSENLGFCYQPISMPRNIFRQYQRYIKNPVKL